MSELITIIIPCYEQAQYLAEAVESVYQQGEVSIEVIVVNDGSVDDTARVAEELQKKYPTLQYIFQENAGVVAACRAALQIAKGDFVLRLDADDYLPSRYISCLLASLQSQPAEVGFAYCDAHFFGTRKGIQPAQSFSAHKLVLENYIHVSALVKMEVVRKVGYFNPAMLYGFEDWDLWLAIVEAGYRGIYCPDTFLYYRQKKEGGRNAMQIERARAMRRQIQVNHPRLFNTPQAFTARQLWRLQKRLQYLFAK